MLRTRRRIAAQPPGWALSADGLRSLRRQAQNLIFDGDKAAGAAMAVVEVGTATDEPEDMDPASSGGGEGVDPLAAEFAEIDAALARSEATLAEAKLPGRAGAREKDPLVYDLDWNEDGRLGEWQAIPRQLDGLPPVLQAALALDAWNGLAVLQHAPWLSRLLAAAILRQAGLTTAAHLTSFNLGLKSIPADRRRHRDRETRLMAIVAGLTSAAELGLKEHDRLLLARQMMERRLVGRRSSSKLPELIELVMSRPLVSAGMVAKALHVTPRAALRIVEELGLREMTGRGRFRAWGTL